MKMKIFNAVVLMCNIFGVDTKGERRLDAFEMGMLRSIVGVRWDDFVRNVDIRMSLRQPPVSLKLRRARLKRCGHVERMGDERQVKKIMNA